MNDTSALTDRFTSRCRRHAVTLSGTDGPLLVLQHGFGTDLSVWNKVLPALEPHFRVLRMNLAGAGADSAEAFNPADYDSIAAHADDILLVMNDLGIDECFFAGASVGSMVGMLASIERPRLFRKIVALGASPRYLNDTNYLGGFEQAHLDSLYEAMSRDYQGWVSGFAPLAVRGLPGSEAVQEFANSLFSLRPDIALSTARTIFQSDVRDQLPLITVPIVLLQMPNDIAVPMSVGEYLQAHLPNATLEVLPAEGHFPHISAPDVVSAALLRHLH